jgi:hypothetical protein
LLDISSLFLNCKLTWFTRVLGHTVIQYLKARIVILNLIPEQLGANAVDEGKDKLHCFYPLKLCYTISWDFNTEGLEALQ